MSELDCLSQPAGHNVDVRWDVALVLAQISQAVYKDPADQVRLITGLGAPAVTPLNEGTSEGVVASNSESVVIAFRGTKGFDDFVTDARILGDAIGGGRMHRGFFRSVNALYDKVLRAARRHDASGKTLWITGHSLGGGMAAAFAYRLLTEKQIRAKGIVTFGQPLVMTTVPAQLMLDEFQEDYVRFVNNWDCVSRMLPNYRHTGARVHPKANSYSLRKPMIACSAAPGAPDGPPSFQFEEDDDELQLMTEAELQEFEMNLKSGTTPPAAAASGHGPAVGAWYDPFTPHYMESYLPRLRHHARPRA